MDFNKPAGKANGNPDHSGFVAGKGVTQIGPNTVESSSFEHSAQSGSQAAFCISAFSVGPAIPVVLSKPDPLNPFSSAEITDALAIDCEGVGVGPKGKSNVVARVSIVNEYGECVYDTFVKSAHPVTDYRTWLTGIRQEDLENGRGMLEVRNDIRKLLNGRKLVGHALHNDFRMLGYSHPEHLTRDTSTYDPFRSLSNQCHPSLKTLANLVLGLKIQDGIHDPIIDARTAMQLYQKHKKVWEASEYGWPELPGKK